MAEIPPWGRANRRIERQAARELAESLIREGRQPKRFRWDITLACVFGVIGVLLSIFPPQSRQGTVFWLLVMAGMGVYPALHFSEVIPIRPWAARIIGCVLMIAIVIGFGYFKWPPVRRHYLSGKEGMQFEGALRSQKGDKLQIQLGCPASDEKTCIFAKQFVALFGESGWNIEPFVNRVSMSSAQDGVVVYKRGGDKETMMKNWNSGGWFQINEPHVLAIQNAFRQIHIEIDTGVNPDLADDTLMVYFGPERDDESAPTRYSKESAWATGKTKGEFPKPQ